MYTLSKNNKLQIKYFLWQDYASNILLYKVEKEFGGKEYSQY